jgi:hypothetical protein
MKEVISGQMESSKNKFKRSNDYEFKSLKKIIMLMKLRRKK